MSRLTKPLILAVASLAIATPTIANPGNGNGNGWGGGNIPPGQLKKLQQQQYVQPQYVQPQVVVPVQPVQPVRPAPTIYPDVLTNYVVIQNPNIYGLPPLQPGQLYVRQDDQVYKIMRDTATVISALGIVSDILN